MASGTTRRTGQAGTRKRAPKRTQREKKRQAREARKAIESGDIPEGEVGGQCGAETRGGTLCEKAAGWGTDHVGIGRCKLHGGNMPTHVKRAQLVQAVQAVETYGLPREVLPFDALLEELQRTAGHVAWLGAQVRGMEGDHLVGPVGESGLDLKTGTEHHPGYEPSVWLKLYQAERKHLTDVAATCIKCGIAERQVRIAEQQGQLLAEVIAAILKDLKVPADKARPIVRKHLTAVQGQARELAAA